MNRKYENGIKKNILTQALSCRLIASLIILFIAYGCASTNPAIIKAASSGDINTVKRLRAEGRNINEVDSNGSTALMYAIWSKKPDVAKYLIESGADVKAKDNNNNDAITYAVDYKQYELINILIDKGADTGSRDYMGRTFLANAVLYKQYELINILIDKGVDIDLRDNYGWTPLLFAVWKARDINLVKLLIKKGANVNVRNDEFDTPLDLALTIDGRMDIVNELINGGAKLFEPEAGKARLFFIGEGFFLRDTWVSIGDRHKNFKKGSIAFIDVDSGNQTIAISVSWPHKQPKASIDVKAGKTYYFTISPTVAHNVSTVLGLGIVPIIAVEGISGTGPFNITLLEESVAKEKIKALLKQ